MSRRKRWPIFAGVLLSLATGYAYHAPLLPDWCYPEGLGNHYVGGQYVGWTREAIESRFGTPTRESAGLYGNPPIDYVNQHPAATTMTYEKLRGTLLIAIEPVNGVLTCFSSDWVPNGVILD
jgi:hypothetical protein